MTASQSRRGNRVVITGTGVVCPIGVGTPAFGAALRAGKIGARLGRPACPEGDLDPVRQVAAYLPELDLATALTSASAPAPLRKAAERAASRSALGLRASIAAAIEAWCDAGLQHGAVPGERIALVVAGNNLAGRYTAEIAERYRGSTGYVPGRYALTYQDTNHVGTLSEVLGITGEGCTIAGASASGNVGLIHASRLIELGAADACLVVGAMTDLSPVEWQAFVNIGAMTQWVPGADPASLCRPFDIGRKGFVYGQAAACTVLEAARSAHRRGAAPLAELPGYAIALDANSLAHPNPDGEARVMTQAMGLAGIRPADVDYVNTHGTGSPLGDEAEIAALAGAFGPQLGGPVLNATKGLVGHCLSAAGVLEAIAVIIQMRDGFIHPNVNLLRPIDERCRFAGGQATDATIGYALSNAFGFGGINTCVTLAAPA